MNSQTRISRPLSNKSGTVPLDQTCAAPPSTNVLTGSNRDDDLSDLPARFQIAVCLDNLVEWKHSVDDWLQRAFLQTVDHKIYGRLLARGIAARVPDVVSFYC